jgi:hypothetical protein
MGGLIGLLTLVVATPLGRALFSFAPASFSDLGVAILSGFTVLVAGLAMPVAASPRQAM